MKKRVESKLMYLDEKVVIKDETLTKVLEEGIFRGLNKFGHAIIERDGK